MRQIGEIESSVKEPERLNAVAEKSKTLRVTELKRKKAVLDDLIVEYEACEKTMKLSENNALDGSEGKRLEQSECYENKTEWKAMQKEQKKRKNQLEAEYGTKADVIEHLRRVTQHHHSISIEIRKNELMLDRLQYFCNERLTKQNNILEFCKRELTRDFGNIMKNHGMKGNLEIVSRVTKKHPNKTLTVDVYPTNDTVNSLPVNLTSLSGGERSKTLLFLIHSLWKQLSSPFRALDEWDVFLDDKARRALEEILVETCKNWTNHHNTQFFFISPQNSAYANGRDPEELVKIIKLEKN